ncbi:hypothetical protein [Sulfurimonas sp.]|uniref:hypothetical protein n=1 Tax=Sulfurimonas sp. TaxID=2022749 RepID=UPI0035668060
MFIGWIRKKSFEADLNKIEESMAIDKSLIQKTYLDNSSLCFGAYNDENNLVAFISAYDQGESFLINNFFYTADITNDVKKRLLKLLLDNINEDEKPIMIMAKKDERGLFSSFKFNEFAKFKRAYYSGGGVAFNFTNATSKSITTENYIPIMINIDKIAFNTNRMSYTKDVLLKQSSLVLANDYGYQHSYAINKSLVKISPWVMKDAAFSEAEKMIRGIIYHRGLKKIYAFIPSDVDEITDLYASYKFDLSEEYTLYYKNSKPFINLEMVYAF